MFTRKDGRYQVNFRKEGKTKNKVFPATTEGLQRAREFEASLISHRQKRKADTKPHTPEVRFKKTKRMSQDSLQRKYKKLMADPQNTVADLFDWIMQDMDLPYTFNDVRRFAQEANKARMNVPPKLRLKIFERDKYTCQACGRHAPNVELHADHIVPISRGGLTEKRNLQTLCVECNLAKSNNAISRNEMVANL